MSIYLSIALIDPLVFINLISLLGITMAEEEEEEEEVVVVVAAIETIATGHRLPTTDRGGEATTGLDLVPTHQVSNLSSCLIQGPTKNSTTLRLSC